MKIVSVTTFQVKLKYYFDMASNFKEAIVVTQNGGDGVVV